MKYNCLQEWEIEEAVITVVGGFKIDGLRKFLLGVASVFALSMKRYINISNKWSISLSEHYNWILRCLYPRGR